MFLPAPTPRAAYRLPNTRAPELCGASFARPDAEEYARAYRNEDGPGYLWRGKVDLTRASVRRVTGGDEECDGGYYEDVVLDAIRSGADVACHVDGIVALAASAQVTWELLGRVAPDPHRNP